MPAERKECGMRNAECGILPVPPVGIVALMMLMVLLPTTGCTTHAQKRVAAEQRWNHVRADVKYQLATQQFEQGQIEAAIETVNEAIGVDDSSTRSYLLLAQCYLEQGKLASAQTAAAQAQRCDPQSAEVEYTLGLLAERTDALETALDHYRRARARESTIMDYLVAEAECLAALGRPEEALVLVSDHLDRFDSDGTLELLLAQLALLVGEPEMAVRNLRLALERSGCASTLPQEARGCDLLIEEYGRLLSETGRNAEAVALLRPYVELRPDAPPSAVTALAAAYLATGHVGEAEQLLRDTVRRHPDRVQGWLLLTQAAVMTEDWTAARRYADRLERLAPHGAPAQLLHGYICWKQGDLETAEGALRRALSIEPDDALSHALLGRVLERSGRSPAAQEHYRQGRTP